MFSASCGVLLPSSGQKKTNNDALEKKTDEITASHLSVCLSSPVCLSVLQGKLTSQGKLLQQETFCVWEQDGGVLSRSKERRVFLFEQIVIFSELLRKGSNNPGYQYKNSIKVSLVHTGSRHGSVSDWFTLRVTVISV